MDNLTHSLVGALIGQAGLKRRTGLAMPALVIGANLPDIDATCVLLDGMQHLALRRGITHGPVAWIVLPLLLAGALWGYDRWQARRGRRPEARLPVNFGWLWALSLLAFMTHPALDWLNVYGIRLLEPFSDRWFHGDTLFIIDVWLWAGMGLALWLSLRREKQPGGNWRRPAQVALIGAGAYILANGAISGMAAMLAKRDNPYPETVVANPVPALFWRREVLWRSEGRYGAMDYSVFGGITRRPRSAGEGTPIGMDDPRIAPIAARSRDASAFLFWSRMPVAERRGDAIVIRDQRFLHRAVSGGFSVELKDQ